MFREEDQNSFVGSQWQRSFPDDLVVFVDTVTMRCNGHRYRHFDFDIDCDSDKIRVKRNVTTLYVSRTSSA